MSVDEEGQILVLLPVNRELHKVSKIHRQVILKFMSKSMSHISYVSIEEKYRVLLGAFRKYENHSTFECGFTQLKC